MGFWEEALAVTIEIVRSFHDVMQQEADKIHHEVNRRKPRYEKMSDEELRQKVHKLSGYDLSACKLVMIDRGLLVRKSPEDED